MNKQQAVKVLQSVEAHTVREIREALRVATGCAVPVDFAREFHTVASAARALGHGGVWVGGRSVVAYWYRDGGAHTVTVRRDAAVVRWRGEARYYNAHDGVVYNTK